MPPFASSQFTVLYSLKAFQNYLPTSGKAKDRENRKTVEALCLKSAGGSVSGILVQIEKSPPVSSVLAQSRMCGGGLQGVERCWIT